MTTLRQLCLNGHESHGDQFNPHIGTRTWVVIYASFSLVRACLQGTANAPSPTAPEIFRVHQISLSVTSFSRTHVPARRPYAGVPSGVHSVFPGQNFLEEKFKKVSTFCRLFADRTLDCG